MKGILVAYFERFFHQLLEGTEEIYETLIGSSQSLGLQIGIWGLEIHSRNGNHYAATFSTSLPSKSNTIAG